MKRNGEAQAGVAAVFLGVCGSDCSTCWPLSIQSALHLLQTEVLFASFVAMWHDSTKKAAEIPACAPDPPSRRYTESRRVHSRPGFR